MTSGRAGDDDVLVLPPLPADPLFVDAVEEAVAGGSDDLPHAQPERRIGADPRDFASLYMRHRASFGLHARRFLYDQRDVDEVLQEAFLRLFLAMPELETELQALAYCRRTVTNLCIDRYRADQRRPRLVDLDAVEWDPSDEASYDDPVLRAEDAAIVRQALALLTPMHRAALVKREIEEKPLPQIAAELGIPEDSVKHLLYRARRALRRLLVGTSVEPGADLSNTAILRLANERLARATLRSANVLIVLFVTAVTVVGALRVGVQDQQTRSGEVGAVLTPQMAGGQTNPPHPLTPVHEAPAKPSSPQLNVSRPTAAAPSVPAQQRSGSVQRPERVGHRAPVVSPHVASHVTVESYRVRGSIRPTGPVAVTNEVQVHYVNDASTSLSELTAPVGAGSFVLDQLLISRPEAAPEMQLTSRLITPAGETVTLPMSETQTVIEQDAATREFSVTVTASVGADASAAADGTPAAPRPTVLALLTYDPAMKHVLSESVITQRLSVTEPPAQPVTPSATSAGDTQTPEASPTGQSPLANETTWVRADDATDASSS